MSADNSGQATALGELMRRELCAIPIENWRHYLPADIAAWRFIQAARPNVLSEVSLRVKDDAPPVFRGTGATRSCEELTSDERYAELVDGLIGTS
jgi:hypothetical protein